MSYAITAWKSVPRGIWALGLVSMLMDISSEMIHALLPIYLVTVLVFMDGSTRDHGACRALGPRDPRHAPRASPPRGAPEDDAPRGPVHVFSGSNSSFSPEDISAGRRKRACACSDLPRRRTLS